MSKTETRAKPQDVQRRWDARMWLTDAIQRALAEGRDVAPAIDLLSALEGLDAIEVVENMGQENEAVVSAGQVGPAGTALTGDQVMRLVGRTDRMLTMPETSDTIVCGPPGGRKVSGASNATTAFASAAITRMTQLGMSSAGAVAFVEEVFGPTESDRKKIRARSAPANLISDYNDALAQLSKMSSAEVIASIMRVSGMTPQR